MWKVFLMYALFGSIFSIGKIGIANSQPYFLTGTRMLLAGSLLLCFYLFKHRQKLIFSKEEWKLLFLVAFFNVFITNAFEFWGLQYMSAAKTSVIYNLSPFAAALIAYTFGTELMSKNKWLGLSIGILALCPMMFGPLFTEASTEENSLELLAECALTISAITAVIGWTFVKKLTVEKNMSHLLINGISFLMAGGMCLLTSASFETWDPVPVSSWPEYFLALIYIVLIHNIICYSIYASSLKKFSVTFMSFAGLTCNLFAALFGWLILGEAIGNSFWIAFVGIMVGLYLFYQEEKDVAIETSTQLEKSS